jgi:hypothetical protein
MRLIALLLLFASSVTDYSGTWVLNIEKSQLGTPTPKSNVMKVEKTGPKTFLASFDVVLADGRKSTCNTRKPTTVKRMPYGMMARITPALPRARRKPAPRLIR